MKQKSILIIFIVCNLSLTLAKTQKPVIALTSQLKYSVTEIFNFVLAEKKQIESSVIQFPKIFYKSKISLKQFQDAIESQWGFRPLEITNAYVVRSNEIYLLDDADYYLKTERCMDDSLTHELVHFVQSKYQKFDLNDESLEWDAIGIQTLFREKYCPVIKQLNNF